MPSKTTSKKLLFFVKIINFCNSNYNLIKNIYKKMKQKGSNVKRKESSKIKKDDIDFNPNET